ncbi:hypothetical protein CDL12_24036 [Handroanthus impetiginosus]|uniref:Uncharacterized protein n=1 Tax=Handroanthus impetiginosus TaxID=429701 RepID=A0A2G9GDS7_9LAMI|nr:hypothetical protein CDL12_24036 [Handroanthus impetiginosus]
MSEKSGDLTENCIVGPDFFGFYTSEVTELLSQNEGLLPFTHQTSHLAGNLHEVGRDEGSIKNSCRTQENNGISGSASLFSNGIGALVSEFKRERLKSLLRQSVLTLTQEVDEVIMKHALYLSLCLCPSDMRSFLRALLLSYHISDFDI